MIGELAGLAELGLPEDSFDGFGVLE